jgi:hypothetical protein
MQMDHNPKSFINLVEAPSVVGITDQNRSYPQILLGYQVALMVDHHLPIFAL